MKTKSDPTGLARTRNAASKTLIKRLNRSERAVIRLFRDIPRTFKRKPDLKTNRVVYDYELTAEELEQLRIDIEKIINDELLESDQEITDDWYWNETIEQPYRRGTIEEVNETNRLIAAAIAFGFLFGKDGTDLGLPVPIQPPGLIVQPVTKIEPRSVLTSEKYQEALRKVQAINFGNIKTLSDTTANQAYGVINRGINAGLPPAEIADQIKDRFRVSKSSAKRIAETEVNKAYNDAKMNFSSEASEELGYRAGVLHISALSPTTRDHHAARHGNYYTVEDQEIWWNEGVNRINCKCTVKSVLLDKHGNLVDTKNQDKIKAERAFFE